MTESKSLTGAVAGGAATLGWTLHDLALSAAQAEPGLALKLLPGSLLVLAVVALIGTIVAQRLWLTGGAVALIGLAAVLPRFIDLPLRDATLVLPKAAMGLALGALLGWLVGRSRGIAAVAVAALGGGALFAAALVWVRADPRGDLLRLEVAIVIVALAWIATVVVSGRVRLVATGAMVAITAGGIAWTASHSAPPPRPEPPAQRVRATPGAPNVLLIVLDTVAAQHLAPYGYQRVTTPKLDAFAARYTTRHEQARSASSWTLPSHGALFTGLQPSQHGATHRRGEADADDPLSDWPAMPMRRDVPTLAGDLASHGWQTAAIIGNSPFVSRQFGFDRGFEYFDDRPGSFLFPRYALAQLLGFHPGIGSMGYRRGETITDLALEWLDARKPGEPFFLFLNYMDVHYPFIPAPEFARAHAARRLDDPLRIQFDEFAIRYDRELTYMDHHLGRLLDAMVGEGRLSDTLIVITSDHGEVFGAKGFWFHNFTLYEDLVRVPLYVHRPGQSDPGVSTEPVDLIDVHHLVRETVGLPAAEGRGQPGWIGEWYRDEQLIADVDAETQAKLRRDLLSWIEDGRKVIVDSDGKVELFDVFSDPRELRQLPVDEATREAARARAARWWAEHPPVEASAAGQLDDATMDRLRNLGYVK